ncbi:hypothetical protein RCJ22_03240, partial [Vibrio sp. FNV 38]|nr:hypothetical protein [Vibrio sp. FNV 38]
MIKDMPSCHIVVAKPEIGVSTPWVYKELDKKGIDVHPDIDGVRKAIEDGDVHKICDLIGNVLEPVTAGEHEVIGKLEKIMEDNGAIRAFMTGSGPTVFGIFDNKETAEGAYKA